MSSHSSPHPQQVLLAQFSKRWPKAGPTLDVIIIPPLELQNLKKSGWICRESDSKLSLQWWCGAAMTTRANAEATATALEEEATIKQQHQQRRKAAALL